MLYSNMCFILLLLLSGVIVVLKVKNKIYVNGVVLKHDLQSVVERFVLVIFALRVIHQFAYLVFLSFIFSSCVCATNN